MEIEDDYSFAPDEPQGPQNILTEEQERTRRTHVRQEGAAEWKLRTDPELSTLRQNLNGAGVDDRRDETRVQSDSPAVDSEGRVAQLPPLD